MPMESRPSLPGITDRAGVNAARRAIHDDRTLRGLSETFKVLGDQTRLKICLGLARRELCVATCSTTSTSKSSSGSVSGTWASSRAPR